MVRDGQGTVCPKGEIQDVIKTKKEEKKKRL